MFNTKTATLPHRLKIAAQRRRSIATFCFLICWIGWTVCEGADRVWPTSHGRNWREENVGTYVLPDPLEGADGQKIDTASEWQNERRGEILRDFSRLMYGRAPELSIELSSEVTQVREDAVDGLATRKLVALRFFDDPDAPAIHLMVYLPNAAEKPAPTFVGMNWYGNSGVEADPDIPLSTRWMRPSVEKGIIDNRATEATRGVNASMWPLREILERGYGVATFYYGDVEPDHIDGWRDGIRGYVLERSGRSSSAPDEWGALGAWAWGMRRALDYLETDSDFDADRVALIGHSRQGKAALWAGAQDERFALVISNDSGEGGASLARRNFGENIAYSIAHASWRYCERFRDFIGRADELPFDQHMLLALIAPRPLYVASASEDLLADPKGEFLSAARAAPVYRLFGLEGLGTTQWPPQLDKSIGNAIGYHLRSGDHALTRFDWEQYLDFADRHLRKTASTSER